jgi:hypothetical protein
MLAKKLLQQTALRAAVDVNPAGPVGSLMQ